jgi:hypothetical protein
MSSPQMTRMFGLSDLGFGDLGISLSYLLNRHSN